MSLAEATPLAQGDVVLARKDAPASYHLSCTLDDAAMGTTHVLRGNDLRETFGLRDACVSSLKPRAVSRGRSHHSDFDSHKSVFICVKPWLTAGRSSRSHQR